MDRRFFGIIALLFVGVRVCEGHGRVTERILLEKLLKDYDVNARPVWDIEAPVNVSLSVGLNQIIDLDERSMVLTTQLFLRMVRPYWSDVQLQWNSSEYGGLDSVRIYVQRIWRPDITLYNDLTTDEHHIDNFPAAVYSDGSVVWLAPVIFRSTCLLDVRYFPWDSQICNLTFGSWTYDSGKINLISHYGSEESIDAFVENGEWILESIPVTRNLYLYGCCPNPYVTIDFSIKIKRKPLYYIINLILPCVFISATAILVFYLPPDSGEKVSLAVTVLLASTVFLLLAAGIMPPQSDVIPLIGQFFLSMILILSLCTVLTVVVLNLHHRGAYGIRPPSWLRMVVLNWLATAVGLRALVAKNSAAKERVTKTSSPPPSMNGYVNRAASFEPIVGRRSSIESTNNNQPHSTTERLLAQMLLTLQGFGRRKAAREQAEAVKGEWMLIALVLDRFFLIVFSVGSVAVGIGVVVSHP